MVTVNGAGPPRTARAASSNSFRQAVYTVLEEGQMESPGSRIVEGLLVALIIANVAAVAFETVPYIKQHFQNALTAFEHISIGAYTIEYAFRLWSSVEDPRIAARGPIGGRISFALRPLMIIDFLAFAPSYLAFIVPFDTRLLRIFRLLRLVKLARYSQALPALLSVVYSQRSALFASFILTLCVMCVSAELMYMAEHAAQPKMFDSMPTAMYWAVTTLTTTGYGDLTPVTPLGRLLAGVTMMTGLLLFALPIGILANGFVSDLNRRQFAITWSMMKRQPLFADMDLPATTEILAALSAKLVPEHAHVVVAGESANTLYLIASGRAHYEGKTEAYDLEPGDVFGQESLDVGVEYAANVTAQSEMRLLVFYGDDLRRLARKYPLLQQRIANKVAW